METIGAILLQLLQLGQRLLALFKSVQRQKEQEDLEANPGHHLHDHFSTGLCSDDENEAAKADIRKRL